MSQHEERMAGLDGDLASFGNKDSYNTRFHTQSQTDTSQKTKGFIYHLTLAFFDYEQTSTLHALIRDCTLIYFMDFLGIFVKHSGLIWNFFGSN